MLLTQSLKLPNALPTFLCYESARPSSVHSHQIDRFLCHSSRTSFLSAARSWIWHNGLRGCYQSVISYESLAVFLYSYMSLANFDVPSICLPFLNWHFVETELSSSDTSAFMRRPAEEWMPVLSVNSHICGTSKFSSEV